MRALLLADLAPGVWGEAINVACGESHTVLDLVAILGRILGWSLEVRHTAALPGDVRHSLAEISKAKRLLGYEP